MRAQVPVRRPVDDDHDRDEHGRRLSRSELEETGLHVAAVVSDRVACSQGRIQLWWVALGGALTGLDEFFAAVPEAEVLHALPDGVSVTFDLRGDGGGTWKVSRDDGQTWDFDGAYTFYNPCRPIGGRACARTIQLDKDTIGTVFYDGAPKQPDGPGVFFLRTPLSRLQTKDK